jgi:hypothetical protein
MDWFRKKSFGAVISLLLLLPLGSSPLSFGHGDMEEIARLIVVHGWLAEDASGDISSAIC